MPDQRGEDLSITLIRNELKILSIKAEIELDLLRREVDATRFFIQNAQQQLKDAKALTTDDIDRVHFQ